jgi:hypothetical protein
MNLSSPIQKPANPLSATTTKLPANKRQQVRQPKFNLNAQKIGVDEPQRTSVQQRISGPNVYQSNFNVRKYKSTFRNQVKPIVVRGP